MPNIKYKSDAQARRARNNAQAKYHKEHMRAFTMKFHKETDASIIAKLDTLDNKTNYIRDLILKDLNENKQN